MTLQRGTHLGPYEIVEHVGSGGMGEVYRALDTRLQRAVAIKVLRSDLSVGPEHRQRFEREARVVSSLNHPNICTLYDVGQSGQVDYLVMEFLEGQTLAQRLAAGRLDLSTALRYSLQISGALAAAHSAGMVHRDIKPGNILLTSSDQVKVLDFGLAKPAVSEVADSSPTVTAAFRTERGAVLGTVAYMSPEQAEGKPVDARSDVFSFGSVLYEMLAGQSPFARETQMSTVAAILRDEPAPVRSLRPDFPVELERVLRRCLEKKPEARYPSGVELQADLAAAERKVESRAPGAKALLRRPWVAGLAALLLLAAAIAGWALWQQSAKAHWARATALPEIERFVAREELVAAFDLAQRAERYIPGDRELAALRAIISRQISIDTTPAGADVHYRHFGNKETAWRSLGQTPVTDALIPRGFFEWRISKPGYVTVQDVGLLPLPITLAGRNPPLVHTYVLEASGGSRPEMVRVSRRSPLLLSIAGMEHFPPFELSDFWIDRYEVTNRAFKAFVDAGGYREQRYWRQPFVLAARPLSWDKALAVFRDKTGRPGPATWEFGSYPEGKGDEPVGGVSWYEAAAYAEFAGKMLPTIFHWSAVADRVATSAALIPLGRYHSDGPLPVGRSGTLSRYGTYDLAGNVKEWCWNEAGSGRRYTLGGGWSDPAYYFNDADGRSPWHREASFGFRCMRLLPDATLPAGLLSSVEFIFRDFSHERPVSDEVFRAYASLYTYDRGELAAAVQPADETARDWRRETVTFNAAYGGERLVAHLILPKHSKPPFQTLVLFPGITALHTRSSLDGLQRVLERFDFVVRGGRALVLPVYKDTFERLGDVTSDYPNTTTLFRDHVIMWSKDLQRTVDYLETRPDIAQDKIGYLGLSWGSAMGAIMVATEPRLKLAILIVGGFYFQRARPEVEAIHFAPRVRVPSLMLNGRYDFFFPVDTSQVYMYRLLGVAEPNKRWVVYETSHGLPRTPLVSETLQWLDRYFGPVDTQ